MSGRGGHLGLVRAPKVSSPDPLQGGARGQVGSNHGVWASCMQTSLWRLLGSSVTGIAPLLSLVQSHLLFHTISAGWYLSLISYF